MTGLRWYKKRGLSIAGRHLKQRLENGITGWLDYAVEASQYLFRNSGGDYSFLDVYTEQWFHFESGSWHLSTTSPDNLEGLDSLSKFVDLPVAASSDLPDPFAKQVERKPVEVVELFQQTARLRYRDGISSSTNIEGILASLLLLDEKGTFWTIGFRSGKWYRFLDGKWDQAIMRPDTTWLVVSSSRLDDLPEDAAVQIYRFLLSGAGTLPEEVTDPWNPPESYPILKEPGATCDLCGAHNLLSSRYCSQCAAHLGCPNCGNQLPVGKKFCNRCGFRIS
jgi:hypothetical protein